MLWYYVGTGVAILMAVAGRLTVRSIEKTRKRENELKEK